MITVKCTCALCGHKEVTAYDPGSYWTCPKCGLTEFFEDEELNKQWRLDMNAKLPVDVTQQSVRA